MKYFFWILLHICFARFNLISDIGVGVVNYRILNTTSSDYCSNLRLKLCNMMYEYIFQKKNKKIKRFEPTEHATKWKVV